MLHINRHITVTCAQYHAWECLLSERIITTFIFLEVTLVYSEIALLCQNKMSERYKMEHSM